MSLLLPTVWYMLRKKGVHISSIFIIISQGFEEAPGAYQLLKLSGLCLKNLIRPTSVAEGPLEGPLEGPGESP